MTRGSSREWSNHGKSLVSPRTMMKVPRTSRTMMKVPRTMLNKKGCWEIPGGDGVGVMGVCVRGHGGCGDGNYGVMARVSKVLVVMAWGCGDGVGLW